MKENKTTADLGYKSFIRLADMTSEKEVAYSLKDSNTVISCVGSHVFYQKDSEFEEANIKVPMAIAKAVKNSGTVKRFIYISAAGASPDSYSKRLRTKWIGEQEVKDIYPDVTILRPTLMFNTIHQTPTITAKWGMMMKMFNRMDFCVEGQNGTVEPVFTNDVAMAILNSLKMEETTGKSFDLGGPHSYTYQEMYEMFYNITQIKPYTNLVKFEDVYEMKHANRFVSWNRYIFRPWLNPEFMTVEAQNL